MSKIVKLMTAVAFAAIAHMSFAYNGGYENSLICQTLGDGRFGNDTIGKGGVTVKPTAAEAKTQMYAQCRELRSVDLSSLTELGDAAFAYSALTSVELPATLKSIGYIAFGGCKSLTSVTINSTAFMTSADEAKEPFRDCAVKTVTAKCAPPAWDFKKVFPSVTTVRCAAEIVKDWKAKYPDLTYVEDGSYVIRFNRNNGQGTVKTKEFDCGISGTLPTAAELGYAQRGYTLAGWATSEAKAAAGQVWKADGAAVKDATKAGQVLDVYAVWTLADGSYGIRFEKNDGSGAWRMIGFESGKSTALPSCAVGLDWACEGYTFKGWATSKAKATDGTVWKTDRASVKDATKAGLTLTVYAIWEKINPKYEIRFNRNNGQDTAKVGEFTSGVSGTLPTAAELGYAQRGYTLAGWATSEAKAAAGQVWKADGAAVKDATKAGQVLDVYAVWKLQDDYFGIRFEKNDGSGAWRMIGFEYGASTAMPSCEVGLGWTRENYTFVGWATSEANAAAGKVWKADKAVVSTTVAAGQTMTVYAIWKAPSYKIRFNRNNGQGTVVTKEFTSGVSVTLPTAAELGYAQRGYTLAGWATSEAKAAAGLAWKTDGASVKDATKAGQVLDVYAVWKLADDYFGIRFEKNDGSSAWRMIGFEYEKSTAMPSCAAGLGWTREDCTFGGWATSEANAAAGKVWKADKAVVSTTVAAGKTLTVYAIWKKIEAKYTIRFNRNNGQDTVKTKEFDCGISGTLPTVASLGYAQRGYTFVGWATSEAKAAAGTVWKKDGASVKDAAKAGQVLDVYAVWKLSEGYFGIRFEKNDGSGAWRMIGFEYGKSTAMPSCEVGLGWTRTGNAFAGWATSEAKAAAGTVWKGNQAVVSKTVAAGQTLTVYAIWETPKVSPTRLDYAEERMFGIFASAKSAFEPGCISGVFADGSGRFDLLLADDGTAFFAAWTEDGAWAAECAADVSGEALLLSFENGDRFVLRNEGGQVVVGD